MNRTITVKAAGKVSIAPDQIEIRFRLCEEDPVYETAMARMSDAINALNIALQSAGFEKGALKTSDFNVNTFTKPVMVRGRVDHYDFGGYRFTNRMSVRFDLDMKLLSKVLSFIASTGSDPDLNISFTLKDPDAAKDALLSSACENGRRKAELMCRASGVKLGNLITVDYSWHEFDIYSSSSYCMETSCLPKAARAPFSADLDPDTVDISDTVTMVWEIE